MTQKPKSWIGQVLGGRYKIESLLGRGGMSSIYRAVDSNLKRDVAVKIIHPHLTQKPEFVQQFEQEATAVAQLRHQNIVRVYDFKREEGSYYIVMEFIPGETLAQKLAALHKANMHLPLTEIVRIAINLCDAVDYAHQRRMIHRDIKPANVMINLLGEPILMDFGIVKMVGRKLNDLGSEAALGTALYMSPEQAQGKPIDYRTDIYALGAVLFEMISGQPVYKGDTTQAILDQQISAPLPDLHALNPTLPQTLITIVERAMQKQSERRYQTVADMTTALQTVVISMQNPLETLGSRHLEHLARLWLQANEAYDDRNYSGCIEKVDELIRTGADYQSEQAAQLRQDAAQQLYEQSVDYFQTGQFVEALVVVNSLRELAPRYPNLGHLDTQIRQAVQSNSIQTQLDSLYEEAVTLLDNRQYQEGLQKWEAIENMRGKLPYRDRMQVERRAKEGICAVLYNDAFMEVSRQNPHQAVAHWKEIKAIDPDFPDEDGVLELAQKLINTEKEIKRRDKRLIAIALAVGVLLVLSQVLWIVVGRSSRVEASAIAAQETETRQAAATSTQPATNTPVPSATAVPTRTGQPDNSRSDLFIFPLETGTPPTPTASPAATQTPRPTATTAAATATATSAPATETAAESPTATPSADAPAGTPTPTNIGLVVENASLFDIPDLSGQELAVVVVDDPVVILGRSQDSKWLFVGDGSVAGFMFRDRVQWDGELGRLPIFTHSDARGGGAQATPAPSDVITELTFDLWPLPETAVCTATGWEMMLYFQGQGGNGVYQYYWNAEPIAGPTNSSAVYKLVSPGGAVSGFGRVESGGNLWQQKNLFVAEPKCP
ncbi:MAG: protein kinase [Chloroflexota bacterium]